MKNSYQTADIVELGKAGQMILGSKYIDWFGADMELGAGYGTWLYDDIDESDE